MNQLDDDIKSAVLGNAGKIIFHLESEQKMPCTWQNKCILNLMWRILLIYPITIFI